MHNWTGYFCIWCLTEFGFNLIKAFVLLWFLPAPKTFIKGGTHGTLNMPGISRVDFYTVITVASC